MRSYLDSYIKDELLVETNIEMQKHLQNCRECAAELEARKHLKNALQRAVRAEAVPPDLRAKIQAGIRASRPVGIFAPTKVNLAIAASLLVFLCLGVWGVFVMREGKRNTNATLQAHLNPSLSEQTRHVLSIGLEDHVHCAVANGLGVQNFGFNNRDLGSEYAGLVPLVEEQLGGDFEIVAAHLCLVHEREFAHLILRNRDETASIVLTEKNGEAFTLDARAESSGAPLYSGRTEDYSVAGFEAGEHLAFVASNLDADENVRVASRIAPGVRRLLGSPQIAVARL